jgi:bifunctional DNA-binding transcriptional regulator/antitoxin component of YhaV-PrlF toxin-antitoxin module
MGNKPAKPRTTTRLRIGDKVYIEDGEDSGEYEIRVLRPEEDDCWLYGEIPDEDDPDETRDIEQQFPMSWIEGIFRSQQPLEWDARKARKP